MHSKSSAILIFALLAFASTSCAANRPKPLPAPIELPPRAEPSFEKIGYATLPPDAKIAVRWTTADLMAKLKSQFQDSLSPARAHLSLLQEDLISSNGVPYRRVWVIYEDTATQSPHGACSQNIYAWFRASGDLADIFVEQLVCPI